MKFQQVTASCVYFFTKQKYENKMFYKIYNIILETF